MNHSAPVIVKVRESLPQYSWRTEQIRQMEQQLIAAQHISVYQLMLRAGEALFIRCNSAGRKPVISWIFCGKGNNGGDGYVLARLAKQTGYSVQSRCI